MTTLASFFFNLKLSTKQLFQNSRAVRYNTVVYSKLIQETSIENVKYTQLQINKRVGFVTNKLSIFKEKFNLINNSINARVLLWVVLFYSNIKL